MAVYFVTGKLGSGKTLCAVGKIREYLQQGRRVATNLDINLNAMMPLSDKQTIIRLPDKPRLADMQLIGRGCEEGNEERYGCLVLDELGTWFNSRNWRDKERLPVIDWFLHARKLHWDIYFIVQDVDSLDGQLVNSLCEHLVCCYRTDRLSIPFIGPILNWIGFNKILPKIHIASVYYGQSKSSLRVARWVYRAKDLYSSYDTDQIFSDDENIDVKTGNVDDMRACYTVLSSNYANRVQLIETLQKEMDMWIPGKTELKSGGVNRPIFTKFSGMPIGQMALVVICGIAALYGFNRNTVEASKQVEATGPLSKIVEPEPVVLTQPASAIPVIQNQTDMFQTMTSGQPLRLTSYYTDGYFVRGILSIGNQDNLSSITIDDARALGYVATVSGRMMTIQKPGYSVQIRLP